MLREDVLAYHQGKINEMIKVLASEFEDVEFFKHDHGDDYIDIS